MALKQVHLEDLHDHDPKDVELSLANVCLLPLECLVEDEDGLMVDSSILKVDELVEGWRCHVTAYEWPVDVLSEVADTDPLEEEGKLVGPDRVGGELLQLGAEMVEHLEVLVVLGRACTQDHAKVVIGCGCHGLPRVVEVVLEGEILDFIPVVEHQLDRHGGHQADDGLQEAGQNPVEDDHSQQLPDFDSWLSEPKVHVELVQTPAEEPPVL